MPVMELKPIKEDPQDYDKIEQAILKIFREEIYVPLLRELNVPRRTLHNSKDDLIEAIQSGKITFTRGNFTGKFSSTLSRELRKLGAEWDKKSQAYKLPSSDLPIELRQAVSISEAKFREKLDKITKKLSDIVPEKIAEKLDITQHFDTALFKTSQRINKTLENISVPIKFTAEERKRVSKEYTKNLQLYIKDFTQDEIVKLRKNMLEHAKKGVRYENLIKEIRDSYDVSQNKAKFLARQETKLMMSKFKEIRYQSAGVDEYYWYHVAGSKDHPVRPMHQALGDAKEKDGSKKIYKFSDPPIDDPNGSKHNPGENFGCRCFSRGIVRF